ncbi:MAG: type II toxin-antitoxin system RelE/ParE family toxin [Terracidiphilus sp.]
MEYSVEITDAALADAENYVRFLQGERQAPLAAERWWNGLLDAIFSLEMMPGRCPVIPEQRHFARELRHLIYRSHRIIFFMNGNVVTVMRIYHGARRPLKRL